ncbi:MAG: TonB-dependent receptor [Saprospiraceae bacterium]|nr:TonB-dependent receptor [Saprospiraceae bacterium]
MDTSEVLSPHQKALRINLDPLRYGSFAEIGAGQEVVRWFFTVGGAAGTISKSMSAYDMKVSDAIYGPCERYVCRPRLEAMLEHEHRLNSQRLKDTRGDQTAFFAFADTVSARNFHGTNECHGWMGIKYQAHPRDEDSQIILHVRMLDHDNPSQQEALGIVGVNLLYGAFFLHHRPDQLIKSLLDGLSTDRIEIDMIEFSGIEFRHVDNRIMSLRLVQLGLSRAAMFAADGTVLQPSEVLRKKAILIERGSFRPVTKVNIDMLENARTQFAEEADVEGESIVELMEITMRNLTSSGDLDLQDFIARAELLEAAGKTVLISDYFEYYRLSGYLAQYTNKPIGIIMGAMSLHQLFDEHYYTELEGGILEAFGRLFKNNTRLYIYPFLDPENNVLYKVNNFNIKPAQEELYGYLVTCGLIRQLSQYDESLLNIFSRDVLKRIRDNDASWKQMVPPEICTTIIERRFFGYQGNGELKPN